MHFRTVVAEGMHSAIGHVQVKDALCDVFLKQFQIHEANSVLVIS